VKTRDRLILSPPHFEGCPKNGAIWQAELTFIHFSDIQNNYSIHPSKNLSYLNMYFGYPKYWHINFGYLKRIPDFKNNYFGILISEINV